MGLRRVRAVTIPAPILTFWWCLASYNPSTCIGSSSAQACYASSTTWVSGNGTDSSKTGAYGGRAKVVSVKSNCPSCNSGSTNTACPSQDVSVIGPPDEAHPSSCGTSSDGIALMQDVYATFLGDIRSTDYICSSWPCPSNSGISSSTNDKSVGGTCFSWTSPSCTCLFLTSSSCIGSSEISSYWTGSAVIRGSAAWSSSLSISTINFGMAYESKDFTVEHWGSSLVSANKFDMVGLIINC